MSHGPLHPLVEQLLNRWQISIDHLGIVLVDHGSVRSESNQLLEVMADHLRRYSGVSNIEAAHMELAEPSMATAYARCVERGARCVLIAPFFLLPGKHWTTDIPRLAAEAAAKYPHTQFHLAPPLGVHDLLAELLLVRLTEAD
jgi:sirohydrochlorin ferrochelatase